MRGRSLAAITFFVALLSVQTALAVEPSCGVSPIQLQILGSATTEAADERAAAAALIWIDGKARVLVDAGPGSGARFMRAGAELADLDVVALTHLRLERTVDLPSVLQPRASVPRTRALSLFGPTGNKWMPSTMSFIRTLFDSTRGAWRHLGELLSPLAHTPYKLQVQDIKPPAARLGVAREAIDPTLTVFTNSRLRLRAAPVPYGEVPTLAWKIEAQGRALVVSSDITVDNDAFRILIQDADMLAIVHARRDNVEPGEGAPGLSPTSIGRLAQAAKVRQVVLTPRAHATLGYEEETLEAIRRHYSGKVTFANDMDCLTP